MGFLARARPSTAHPRGFRSRYCTPPRASPVDDRHPSAPCGNLIFSNSQQISLLRSMMKMRRFACALLGVLLALSSLVRPARADEGMWTFNNVPRAEIKKRYGFDVTDEFLKHLQLASVRFNNGGSGSALLPEGRARPSHPRRRGNSGRL